MQTASSASLTYLASRSASEYTTTERMPISRQARWMRSAISPRLPLRIFLNIAGCSLDDEQRLAVLDRLAVLGEHLRDRAGEVRLDLVHDLHGLDDAQRVTGFDALADVGDGLGARAAGPVEGADHRRLDHVAGLGRGGGGRGGGGRCGGRCGGHRG